jgi:hypothetical protein
VFVFVVGGEKVVVVDVEKRIIITLSLLYHYLLRRITSCTTIISQSLHCHENSKWFAECTQKLSYELKNWAGAVLLDDVEITVMMHPQHFVAVLQCGLQSEKRVA